MLIRVKFKDLRFEEDLPGIPREGDFVRLDKLPKDLRVRQVVWARDGVFLELEDPTRGHIWANSAEEAGAAPDDYGWYCKRCNWLVSSSVPPEHPNFPGSEKEKRFWLSDCDEEIARSIHSS